MLLYDLPLPQDFPSLDEGPLLYEVEGSVLPAISLVLLKLDGGIKELPLGEEVATGGLSELLQTDKVPRRSLVLAQGLQSLLVDHQLAVFFEVQDVALVVKEAALLIPEDCFGTFFLFGRYDRWLERGCHRFDGHWGVWLGNYAHRRGSHS